MESRVKSTKPGNKFEKVPDVAVLCIVSAHQAFGRQLAMDAQGAGAPFLDMFARSHLFWSLHSCISAARNGFAASKPCDISLL